MKKILFTVCILALFIGHSNAQVKSVKLNEASVTALLKSANAIESINKVTPKQIDSVANLYPELKPISKEDLSILYSFIVPQLIPQIGKNKVAFLQCEPFAKLYTNKIEAGAASIIDKYTGTSTKILLNNLKVFFQLYLYVGLIHNNKLGMLSEYQPEQISIQNLDKLFIEARGSEADDVIYFTMAHSFTELFTLITKEYKIPNFYSTN